MLLAAIKQGLMLSLVLPSIALAQTPPAPLVNSKGEVNHKALRAACGGAPPFAVKFSGAKIKGEASLTPDAVKAMLTRISKELGDINPPSLDLAAQAVLADDRVGITFDTAFRELGRSYFCMLETLYEKDGAKKAAIKTARRFFETRVLLDLTSPASYKDSAAKAQRIATLSDAADALKPAFTKAEVGRALGDYKFDKVTKAQIDFVAKSPGMGTISGCAGVLARSEADVDKRILNGLEGLDTGFQNLLSGDGSLMIATMASLGQQLYESDKPSPRLSVDDMLCVKSAGVQVKDAVKDAVKDD